MPALHLGAEIDRRGRKSREALKKTQKTEPSGMDGSVRIFIVFQRKDRRVLYFAFFTRLFSAFTRP